MEYDISDSWNYEDDEEFWMDEINKDLKKGDKILQMICPKKDRLLILWEYDTNE